MGAGAKGHAGVHDDLDAVGVVVLPAGHDGQALTNIHGVVELFPAVLPIFLLHAGGVELVVDAAVFQAFLKQGQHFGGVFIGGQVHVYDDHVPGFVQQFLLD